MSGEEEAIKAVVLRAAADPTEWAEVVRAVTTAFPGLRVSFLAADASLARDVLAAQAGHDDTAVASYYAHYQHLNPYRQSWAVVPEGVVLQSKALVSEDDLVRTEYYNDWMRPQGDCRELVGSVLSRGPKRLWAFTAHVERRATREGARFTRMARRLCPLMTHAVEMNRLLLGLRLDAVLLRVGAEPEGAATLLIAEDRTILYANAPAQALLTNGVILRIDRLGRLALVDPAADTRVMAALRARPNASGFKLRLGQPPHLHTLQAIGLPPDAADRLGMPLVLVGGVPKLLVALRPEAREPEAVRVACALGLTRAEAEVALAIADGATVAEAAVTRGVSIHTARDQLKAGLHKVGVRRQSDLVLAVEYVRRL